MAFPGVSTSLERPRLITALSAQAPLVVLTGPIGAGATTLLQQWATRFADVTWATAGAVPDASGDAMIIDNADALTEAEWERIRALRAARPLLPIRVAVHSRRVVPSTQSPVFVSGLSFTPRETSEYLSASGSNLDPRVVHQMTSGLPAAVHAVVDLKTVRTTIVDEALAALHLGPLAAQLATLAIPEVLTREVVLELGGPAGFIDGAETAGLGEWMPDAGHPLFLLTAPVRAATLREHPSGDMHQDGCRVEPVWVRCCSRCR